MKEESWRASEVPMMQGKDAEEREEEGKRVERRMSQESEGDKGRGREGGQKGSQMQLKFLEVWKGC